ncbi:MAG: tetratricopeptide repeat protein [Nannocystaceae bacterium]|nr:tetratricopeptide repeat protein [Nannocystaceae bacterium]
MVHADAVDDAFSAGNREAAAGRWPEAASHYERARALLGQPSSLLSYDLGTAYAQQGELGRASFHLRQALDFRGNPTAQLAEAARANLAIVRRRAELRAATTNAIIDSPQSWWDLVVETLRAPGVGWLSLVSGFVALALFAWGRAQTVRPGANERRNAVARALLWSLGGVWVLTASLHALSLRADRTAPRAVVLGNRVEAREGPGSHRTVEFAMQGGSEVRIVDRTPGWVLARMSGGIAGWVPESEVGELDGPSGRSP